MGKKALSYQSDEAVQETNTTGVLSPILKFQPEDGLMFTLLNRVDKGMAEGIPVIADLNDGSDADLPDNSEIVLGVKLAGENQYEHVSVLEDNIASWNALTVKEQRNEEYVDQTKLLLDSDRINVRDVDELAVLLNSSAQVDWSNSELYFDRSGVEEKSR